MSLRRPRVGAIFALCLAAALAGPVSSVAAQTPWVVPRTPDGHPDLQGNWTNETLTPLERPRDQGRILTPEEVTRIERGRGWDRLFLWSGDVYRPYHPSRRSRIPCGHRERRAEELARHESA